jgi:Flp pilus assembly protein TadB|tara:strand:+ start:1936 stop:2781 length:846 start_codon:yes stop_codon:yes gene_type:complete
MDNLWFDLVLGISLVISLALVLVLQRSELSTQMDEIDSGLDLPEDDMKFKQWLFPSRMIRQTGIMPNQLVWLYWPVKLIVAILLPLWLLEIFGNSLHWLVLVLTSVVGFFAFDYWLRNRRKQRQAKILHSMSFFVDLLTAYLQSGSSLAQAFDYSARFGFKKEHPIASEAMLVVKEINAGRNYRKALQAMWTRTGVQDLYRLAAVLEVGASVGAPIIDTLNQQAALLRQKQKELITKLINRKSIEMFIPMGLVSIPMFMLIVAFPAGVKIYESFQMFKLMF